MREKERWLLVDDYRTGTLPDSEVEAFEDELFDAAARGEASDAQFLEELGPALRFLGRYDLPGRSTTVARLVELRARGVKIHQLEFGPGENRVELWPDDVELVVSRLDVDVRGHEHVDIRVETLEGEHVKTFRDVGFDPDDGRIYALCEAALARIAFWHGAANVLVLGDERDGRREIARFTSLPPNA